MAVFSLRNLKELLRDPLNIAFALGFPVGVMLLLNAIMANVPGAPYSIEVITPGMAVFGLSFVSLFSGMLIAKDRSSAFLTRLFASPLTPAAFIGGYTLPMLPLSVAQSAVCIAVALVLGLPFSAGAPLLLLTLLPSAFLFIGLGLLCGSIFNDKQVGGVCGALLTNLTAWLSGAWFDLSLVGGVFEGIGNALPFVHATKAGRAALIGDYAAIMPHLWWVIGYAVVVLAVSVYAFRRRMRGAD